MSTKRTDIDEHEVVRTVQRLGQRGASRKLGIPRTTIQEILTRPSVQAFATKRLAKPVAVAAPKKGVKRFIFSSAQDSTAVHEGFLDNLEAYAKYIGADIHIAGFTYGKSLFEDHRKEAGVFHERIASYMTNQRFDIGGKLWFCGEMNTLPTAADPLSGFETYTRSQWGIFPHPRVQLKSIPTLFRAPPKIIMTTGSVTLPNYIRKKVGIKAEFHHVIGAVIVEIDEDGDFFCRHLIADKSGAFQDMTTLVKDGSVSDGHCVEAITWGDIHAFGIDHKVASGCWNIDGKTFEYLEADICMLDDLGPKYQFFHDSLDFRVRNHHNVGDPHFRYKMHVDKTDSVEKEVEAVAMFLEATQRDWCTSYVVDSNHDRALLKWLKQGDYKSDPVNAVFFLEAQAAQYRSIAEKDERFNLLEWAVRRTDASLENVTFLSETDSFLICKHSGGGIECALHGDKGANGAKGNVASFAKMGPKANTADKHAAEIYEGIYQAGHSCKTDQGYNRGGLSSWNHSHIVTYPNGKRTIVTMKGEKYRAV